MGPRRDVLDDLTTAATEHSAPRDAAPSPADYAWGAEGDVLRDLLSRY